MQQLDKAMRGAYRPKDYMEEEKLRGLLFLRLGGSRVAELAHRSLGTPGVTTLWRCSVLPPLQTLSTPPLLVDLQHNLELFFASSKELETPVHKAGYGIMIDEIAVEQQPWWDDRSNQILGLCREHSHQIGTEFCSIEQAHELCDAISDLEVHYVSEVCSDK